MKRLALSLLFLSNLAWAGYAPWGYLTWKQPVASAAALPATGNLSGDVRMELTAFGEYVWNGSGWTQITGSGGSPGGANTNIQFNSAGSFGGSANLTWSGTVLAVTGSVNASNFTDSALTSGLPVLSTAPLSTGTLSGNTTKFVTTTGTLTSGDGVKLDASGNLIDSGSAPATVSSVALSAPAEFTVSGSPVTGSGTLTFTKATQSANTFWGGPTSGVAAAPAFRLLTGADYPVFGGATGIAAGAQGAVPAPSAGQQNNCLLGSGSWGTCGAGSVTSVGLADGSTAPIYTISGSPVTGSGTLTFSLSNQTANKVFAAPNGATGQPTFRLLVGSDLPLPTGTTIGGVESLTCSAGQALSSISTSGVPSCASVGATYTASDSVALSANNFTLVNDSATPGNNKVYGTNGSGTLGYQAPSIAAQGQNDGSSTQYQTVEAPNNQITNMGSNAGLIETGNDNLLKNPNFQASTASASWTTGTGVTAAIDATTKYGNLPTLKVTLTSASGDILDQDVTVSNVSGIAAENSFYVYNSNNVANLQVCPRLNGTTLTGGSNCQAVPLGGSWFSVPASTVGGSGTTSIGVSLYATASTSGSVWVTHAYTGKTRLIGTGIPGGTWIGTVVVTGCTSNWSSGSTTLGTMGTQTGCSYAAYGQAQAPATNVAGFKFASLPPGEYKIEYEGLFGASTVNNVVGFQFTDGTTAARELSSKNENSTTLSQSNTISQSFSYSSSQSNVTWQIFGKASTNAAIAYGTTAFPGTFRLYWYPSTSVTTASLANASANWSGTLTGAGGGWTNTQNGSPAADFSVATTSSTISTTASQNITCSAEATKMPAITCTLAHTGMHKVCASFSTSNSLAAGAGSWTQLTDGSNNQITPVEIAQPSTANFYIPLTLCGNYNATSVTNTFKLRGFLGGAGTDEIFQGASIQWTVEQVSSPGPQPYTTGNVSSTSAGMEHAERMKGTLVGSPSITKQSGSWVSSITSGGTGQGQLNIATGEFSDSPSCTCSAHEDAVSGSACMVTATSISAVNFRIRQLSATTGTLVNEGFEIICMGPH